ncbi:histidine kinase [Streptomyces sp. MK37H]|uniref:sensor histidine kinase n=1 Tax=Streptomyces sp. MK37H TaxID=2699117 RepID=UPI001B39ADA1|nr:histidine kinase [Streptomyces sp. MK37H]MBP8537631.1 two-component sensor histidine kinase [Streptomyces sp. MK37H]
MLLFVTEPPIAPTTWLPVFVTGPLAALALPSARYPLPFPARALGVAAMSLTLSGLCLFVPVSGTDIGYLEAFALLFLIIRALAQVYPVRTMAWTVAALAVSMLMQALRTRTLDGFIAGSYMVTIMLSLGIAMGCVVRATEARRQRAVRDVRQAERLALARDLHDLIAHHMTGIIVQANAARTIHATASEKVEPALEAIVRSGTETLESMRRLVRVLREDGHQALRPGDLLAELGETVGEFSRHRPDAPAARLEASAAARASRFSPEAEATVLRVVREALTNVMRHAPGERVTVRLDADPEWLRVTVTNSARLRPTDPPAGGRGGFGLIGLRERVEALDGTFWAGATGSGQWEVRTSLPRPVTDAGRAM